jgi:hypothetical protein
MVRGTSRACLSFNRFLEHWSDGVMEKPNAEKPSDFMSFSNTPVLQHSFTLVQAKQKKL